MLHSLFGTISLSVGAVVTLTLGLFAYFLIENQKAHLLRAKVEEIGILSALVRNGLAVAVEEGKGKPSLDLLERLGSRGGQVEMSLFDSQGRLLRSSGKAGESLSRLPSLLRRVSDQQDPLVFEQEIQGRPFLTSLLPLPNERPCFSCHGPEPKNLGILQVSLSMESTLRAIAFNRNLLILSAAITLLLMAVAVNFLLNRLVRAPIDRLVRTMSQVEGGDLDVEGPLDSRNELGRLSRSLTSMVQELARARSQIEEQHREQMQQVKHLASLGEMAASVAHEIRNPLAGIKLAVQVLARETGPVPGQGETVAEIMRSIERLDKIVADLLFYSRTRPPALEPVRPAEVIEEALACLQDPLDRAGVRVERDFGPALPLLSWDPAQMVGVFLNLFLNSLQAMPRGGVLTVQARRRPAARPAQEKRPAPPGSAAEKEEVEVRVSDTGAGIPPELLEEIFRPFFTTKPKGTGLGLSLAQRTVEQHRGRIFAQSRVGAGTTICLVFPSPPSGPQEESVEGKDPHRRR